MTVILNEEDTLNDNNIYITYIQGGIKVFQAKSEKIMINAGTGQLML